MSTPDANTKLESHTPTPWERIGSKVFREHDKLLFTADCSLPEGNYEENVANAAFIVRACNSHDALVAIVERFVGACGRCNGLGKHRTYRKLGDETPEVIDCLDCAADRAALKAARGES